MTRSSPQHRLVVDGTSGGETSGMMASVAAVMAVVQAGFIGSGDNPNGTVTVRGG